MRIAAAGYDNGRWCEIAISPRASIVYENILRFSEDSLWSTLAGHFQSHENEKNAQLAACCSSFSSGSVCKTIAVDGNGREWGEVGAAGLHRAVCHSQLASLSWQPLPIRWMDGRCAVGVVGVLCRGRRDGQTHARACHPPVPARLFPTMPPRLVHEYIRYVNFNVK